MTRKSWLDDQSQAPLIDDYAQQLGAFIEAMADGKVEADEVRRQEQRLVALMQEVEPLLDDALHEKVTGLLCELTAYNLMQTLHSLQEARPKAEFHG